MLENMTKICDEELLFNYLEDPLYDAASQTSSSYKTAPNFSDESCGFEVRMQFPEDLMENFLDSCLDEKTEVAAAEDEEMWIEIDLQGDGNEAAVAETEYAEIDVQPRRNKRSFRKSLKKFLCCCCCCCRGIKD